MSEGSDLTKKITETKRQTEVLKNQLQNLIDEGKNLICPSQSKQDCVPEIDEAYENPIPGANKAQIIKSYDKHSNNFSTNIPTHKTEVKAGSPKKVKGYDVKDARKFMKKQKEKLMTQQKETQEEQRIKAEIKKQKLQDLDKKTRELLNKNVQARKERSNSRERSNVVRIDNFSNVPSNLRKAASVDKIDVTTQKNSNLLYPTAPHYVKNSINKKTNKDDPGKIVILARNFTRKGDNKTIQNNKLHTNISTQNKTNLTQNIPNVEITNNLEVNSKDVDINSPENKDELFSRKSPSNIKHLESIEQKGYKPTILFESHEEDGHILPNYANTNIDSVKNILEYKSSNSSKSNSNVTVKSPILENNEMIRQTDLATAFPKVALNQNQNSPDTLNGLPITTNILSNEKEKQLLNKCSVEIQTDNYRKMYPTWLDEQPPQAYPFNFINTIKRKLQSATSQKPTTDIGIQSSIVEYGHHRGNQPVIVVERSSPDSKSVKRSDLRSFISHKCLNLDPQTIEHLELVSKKNYQDTNSIFGNIQTQLSTRITETESESDTSKNIPEISSESGTSLKKNAESVKKALMSNKNPTINTDRIDNMKLVPNNVVTNTVTIRTESESELLSASIEIHSDSLSTKNKQLKYGNTLSVNDKYSTDFDSDKDVSSESLERSRRSIISYNNSGYNQVLFPSPENIKSISTSKKTDSPQKNMSDVNTKIILSNSIEIKSTEDIQKSDTCSLLKSNDSNKNKRTKSDVKLPRPKSKSSSSMLKSTSNKKTTSSRDLNPEFDESKKNLDNIIGKLEMPRRDDGKVTSSKNSSVHTETRPSSSLIDSLSKTNISLQNINTKRGSSSLNDGLSKTDISLQKVNAKRKSSNLNDSLSKTDISLQNINTKRGSSSLNDGLSKTDIRLQNSNTKGKPSSPSEKSDIAFLIEPVVSLVKVSSDEKDPDTERRNKIVKNISVRSSKVTTKENKNDSNLIHLKFEAEIHLLNDFNQSLRRFSELEQVLENLKSKNNITTSKILKNNDAQSSLTARSKTSSSMAENVIQSKATRTHSENSKINYSRGSFINNSLENLNISNAALDVEDNSVVSTGLEIATSIDQSVSVKTDDRLSNFENLNSVNMAGISMNMFEQLMKDEDVRLENLKTILKIREQALLDRIKGELAWLEIQRKHFKETGQLHEASVIKKKQRGILVNHQKEKHEMQRLKQFQKTASMERKMVLKEQRNLIRQQLSTDNMLTKMKFNTPRERRQSGPLKVLQSHTESIRSETSISLKSSSDKDKDVVSITSHHSVVSEFSEIEISSKDISSNEHRNYIKKTLLMRETALRKRRKSAEELLEWHKKLLEEEKRIAILESTASAIISQKPSTSSYPEKIKFKGKQLNQMWFNLTDSETKKFVDDKIYPMSQMALERFCKSAREYNSKSKTLLKNNSDNNVKDSKINVSENIPTQKTSSEKDYISDFENDTVDSQDDVDQSIDILINNYNKVQDDISSLSSFHSKKSDEEEIHSESPKFDKTESEAEISVIETNRTDVKDKATKTKDSSSVEEIKDTINESIPTINQDSSDKAKSDILSETASKISSTSVSCIFDRNSNSERSKSEEILKEFLKLGLSHEDSSIIVSDEYATQKTETDISDKVDKMSQKSQPTISKHSTDQHHSNKSNTSISDNSAKMKHSSQIISQKSSTSKQSASLKLSKEDNSAPSTNQGNLEKLNINSVIASEKTNERSKNLDQNSSDTSKSLNKSENLKLPLEDMSVPLSVLQSSSKNKSLSVIKSNSDVSTIPSKEKSSSLISDKTSITENSTKSKPSSHITSIIIHSNISIKSKSNDIADDQSPELILKTDQTSFDNSESDVISKKPSEPLVLTEQKRADLEIHQNLSEKTKSDIDYKDSYANRPFVEDHLSLQKSSSNLVLTEEKDTIDEVASAISSDLGSVDILNKSFSEEQSNDVILELIKVEGKENKNEDQELIKDVPPIAVETKENLNESQEILLILGESEVKTSSDEEMPEIKIKESLSTSEEILLKLNNAVEEKPISKSSDSSKTDEDLMSQSLLQLYQIIKSDKTEKDNSDASKTSENGALQIVSDLESSNDSNKDRKSQEKGDSDKLLIYDFCEDLIESNVDETVENHNKSQRSSIDGVSEEFDKVSANVGEELQVAKERSDDIDDKSASKCSQEPNLSFKIDENNENQTFLNNLVASSTEINFHQDMHDDSDESKFAFSDKSNESFVINDLNDDSNDKYEENVLSSEKLFNELKNKNIKSTSVEIEDKDALSYKTNDYSSIMENAEEESENKTTSHFSYGVLLKSTEKEASDSFETDLSPNKEEVNSLEEKEHDSLSSANGGSYSEALNLEEQSLATSESSKTEESSTTDKSNSKGSEPSIRVKSKSSEENSSKDCAIDVKKRVSEILADSNVSRGDKSPRLQDLYVTTYDLISPTNFPEKDSSSPKDGHKLVSSIFDSEAKEILREQLAIEEEIKAITEQQQKEQQLPLMYIREIPNKPPPPYTPPSSLAPVPVSTIIPTSDEIEEITMYSAKILHKAYLSNNLANVSISNNTLSLISKDISKDCYKFVFNLCKDIAREHYKRFEEDKSPDWLHISKKSELTLIKPLDTEGLKKHMIAKLKEIFGYQKHNRRENAIIKWSRKKRDHVDEILVMECQQEEAQWTNYEKDELLVKDQITNEIFDSLLKDTAQVFKKLFSKMS